MIDWAIGRLPGSHIDHAEAATWLLFVVVAGVGLLTGVLFFHTHWVTRTRVTHPSVAQLLGQPDQNVDGANVNQALAGETCAIYQAKRVVYCHP